MTYSEPTRTTTRRIFGILVAGLLVVVATLGYPLLTSSSPPAASPTSVPGSEQAWLSLPPRRAVAEAAAPTDVPRSEQPRPQLPPRGAVGEAASPIDIPRDRPQRGALDEADGVVPDGTTVF